MTCMSDLDQQRQTGLSDPSKLMTLSMCPIKTPLPSCACAYANSFPFIHFIEVKHWFSLTVAIVVKVLGHVQNMYVEILLGLCQKGILFFYFIYLFFFIFFFCCCCCCCCYFIESVSIVLAYVYPFLPKISKMSPVRCKTNVRIGQKVLRNLNKFVYIPSMIWGQY